LKRLSVGDGIWALGISLGTAVLVVTPFFALGIASGHDFEFHAASWLDAANQWTEGIAIPRWTEWANHGFGEPRFIFYPPLSWILGAALGSLMRWNAVPIVFIVLVQTLAGLCAFALCRAMISRGAALFGAACYAANPYALLVIYMRSDFAEQLGTAFFPLLLLLGMRIGGIWRGRDEESLEAPGTAYIKSNSAASVVRGQARWMGWFGVVFALVWLSNAPAGVMASYAMALLFAWASWQQRSLVPGIRGAAGLALGLGLAGFYLVPAAYEQRWVNIEQALASGLQPVQNFLFTATDDPEHTWFNWIASGVAILLMVITAMAAVAAHRTMGANVKRANREAWSAVVALSAVSALLMQRPTNLFWRFLPKLRFVQFPWRWMCVLAVGYAFLLSCAFWRMRRGWIWIAVAGVCAAGTATFLAQQAWWDAEDLPTIRAAMRSGTGFDGTDEYDPRGDDHYDLPDKAPRAVLLNAEDADDPAPQAELRIEKWTANDKELRVASPEAARIALRLLDYPAWRIEVNGVRVTAEHLEGSAQMLVPVKAGESLVRVHFVRTADRSIGAGLSLASGGVLLALLVGRLRSGRAANGTFPGGAA
jgi:heme exporter protein D